MMGNQKSRAVISASSMSGFQYSHATSRKLGSSAFARAPETVMAFRASAATIPAIALSFLVFIMIQRPSWRLQVLMEVTRAPMAMSESAVTIENRVLDKVLAAGFIESAPNSRL